MIPLRFESPLACPRKRGHGTRASRGVPEFIRSDNGPEFVARKIQEWLRQVGVRTLYIAPGSPWENGFEESFNSRLRDEFLGVEEFENVRHARGMAQAWREDYNHVRPHGSLGYVAPATFSAACVASVSAPAAPTPSLQRHKPLTQETLITTGT